MNDKQTESAEAFREYRGNKPRSGYGYDLIEWEHEDVKLRQCWDAACEWKEKQLRKGGVE